MNDTDFEIFQNGSIRFDIGTNFSYANSTNTVTSLNPTEDLPYYGEYFSIFRTHYNAVHGYLSLAVCIFGITANVLNIIVLTRRSMVSPTNAILTGLAVADMLVMFSYLPFTVHNYIRTGLSEKERYSYAWAVFTLFHAHFTVVNHTISIWLTVTVAIWRFLAVSFPANAMNWCGMPRAKCAVFTTYIACAIFCIPGYMTFTVTEDIEPDNTITYKVGFSEIAVSRNMILQRTQFWLFSVITKLVPCVALTGLSFGLIRVLYEANKRKQRLKNKAEADKTHDRTTRMLLAVLLLFLLTEFPSGLLALLSGVLGPDFFRNVYLNFGEAMDALALVNSAINFIIYCSMSRQFRDTFALLFLPKLLTKWKPVPVTEPTHTMATTCV